MCGKCNPTNKKKECHIYVMLTLSLRYLSDREDPVTHRKIRDLSARGALIKFSFDDSVFFEGYKCLYFSKFEVLPEMAAHSRLKNHNVPPGKSPENCIPLEGLYNAFEWGQIR